MYDLSQHKISDMLRKVRGDMPQAELSEKSGLSVETISRLEHGHHDPKIGTVIHILECCGCKLTMSRRARKRPSKKLQEKPQLDIDVIPQAGAEK